MNDCNEDEIRERLYNGTVDALTTSSRHEGYKMLLSHPMEQRHDCLSRIKSADSNQTEESKQPKKP